MEENLPPGFRFHPTDEELITHYLCRKVSDNGFTGKAVVDVDLNKCEPWDLPDKASMGEKEWYFFSLRDRKYPTGLRTNRATEAGYWKTTGKDKEIYRSGVLVGMKKTLVFYKGRAPKGEKSNWVMHEYRLETKQPFTPAKVTEMEAVLQQHDTSMPGRHTLEALAEKFSGTVERKGKTVVQFKQIWNWFQNRRYALRAKGNKAPGKLNVSSMPRALDPTNQMRNVFPPSAGPKPTHMTGPITTPSPSVPGVMRSGSDNSYLEFEAKSARDGAWYDVQAFLAHRNLEIGDPEVQVRFAGFEVEEDEWINVKRNVRQRSLPCEASECVAVLAGDLVLCFQEGKDQALYFDATVLDAQRRRHDVRGCRCRFLVRYGHDQSEEIVPLRKICRRPETDYRLQQLHSASANDFANSKPAPLDAAAKAPLPQSTASAPNVVPPAVKDPGLSGAATSAQPSSNAAATVPAGSA